MSFQLNQNLDNLDAFWSALDHQAKGEFKVHTSWPNKVWLQGFISKTSLLLDNKVFVTVAEQKAIELVAQNIEIKTHLVAMSVSLTKVEGDRVADIEAIQSKPMLEPWAEACSKAFGYKIDTDALLPLLEDDNAEVFAYWVDGNIAGTAIAYQTNTTMGVHQVGVSPDYQGKGIGKLLMQHLVSHAEEKGCELMTLQASEAGLPIYVKMGFQKLGNVYHLGA